MNIGIQDWTPDTEPGYGRVIDALSGAGVDLDRVTMTPDRTFWLDVDGGRIAFAVDEDDTEGDWWTATAHTGDGEHLIFEGADLGALAAVLATR